MKLLLTGLLWAAIHGCLFAQAPTVSIPVDAELNKTGPSLTAPSGRLTRKGGYQLMAELGAGVFTGSTFTNTLKAEAINGIRLGPYFYGGIGTGIRLLTEESSFWGTFVYAVVPVYLDLRLYASQGNISPYLAMDAGYSVDVSHGIKALGMMFNPMAGLALARHQKIPVYVEAGYQSQIIDRLQDNLNGLKEKKGYGALVVDVGVQF